MTEKTGLSSRRTVLKLSGAALAPVAGSGLASADHEHPDVETVGSEQNAADSFTLYGELLAIGESADYASVWFQWGPRYEDGFANVTTSEVMYSPGEFSATVDDLEDGDYKFRAVAKDSDDLTSVVGDTMYFTAGHEQ